MGKQKLVSVGLCLMMALSALGAIPMAFAQDEGLPEQISGLIESESFYVPNGTTIIVTSDATLKAIENITIDGTIMALEGASIELIAGDNITIGGKILAGNGCDGNWSAVEESGGAIFSGIDGTNGGSIRMVSNKGAINILPGAKVSSGRGGHGGNSFAYGIGDYCNEMTYEAKGAKGGKAGSIELLADVVNILGELNVGSGGAGGDAIALGRGYGLLSAAGGDAGEAGQLNVPALTSEDIVKIYNDGRLHGGNGGAGGSALAIGDDLPEIMKNRDKTDALNQFITNSFAGRIGDFDLSLHQSISKIISDLIHYDFELDPDPGVSFKWGELFHDLNEKTTPAQRKLMMEVAIILALFGNIKVPSKKDISEMTKDIRTIINHEIATILELFSGIEVPDINDVKKTIIGFEQSLFPNPSNLNPNEGESVSKSGDNGQDGSSGSNGDNGWWMGTEGEDGDDGKGAISEGQPANAIAGDGKDGGSGGDAYAHGGCGGSGGSGGNGGNGADGWAWVEGGNGGTGGDGAGGKKGGSASAKGGDAGLAIRANTIAFYSMESSRASGLPITKRTTDLPISKGGDAYAYGGTGGNGGNGGDGGDGGAAGCWSNPGIGGSPGIGSEIVGIGGVATATPGIGLISGVPVAEPGLAGVAGLTGKRGNDGQASAEIVDTALDGTLFNELNDRST